MIRPFLKKTLKIVTHVQVLVVLAAFALMVLLSYRFMANIERKHLLNDVNNAILNTQAYIEADLQEPETTLGIIAENIRSMILNGAGFDDVCNYLTDTTKFITSDEQLLSYAIGVYGVFDKFDGKFFTGIDWQPPDNYVPANTTWYKAAVEAGGKVGVTEPDLDVSLNVFALTFSRQIFDEDGSPLGVVCLDILLDRIKEYAVNTSVSEGSYGILGDRELRVLAHPHPAFLGRSLLEMNDGEAIVEVLKQGKDISERRATDYTGNQSVLFVRRLNNGWYMAVIAYEKKYYQSVMEIGGILIALGAALAAALSAILLSIVSAKKKAEERTQIMLDATPLCANFWDKNYNNIDCNNAALELFEVSSKEEYLSRFFDFSTEYQPDGSLSKEKAVENIKKAFDEGHCRFEWMHRNSRGEMIPSEVTLVRVKYRDEYVVAGYTHDLRELKSIMAKMREADECTQVIFDATPLSSCLFDRNYKIVECNQETLRLYELSRKTEFIDNFYSFSPKYQPCGKLSKVKSYEYIDEAFEEGFCRFEWMHQKLNGEPIPVEVTLVRVKFKGEYAVAGYTRDLRELKAMISEMRRAEIAEASNKAKSDFLAKMSHEIRTPMNAILGIAEIQLQDSTLPEDTRDALGRIYNSGDLLLGIINDILDLSKIEAGKLEISPASYDVASLIHDIVQINVIRYKSKPIEFKLDVSEELPSVLIGDELRIKQVLNNLLSNAFKYTLEGMVTLSVFLEQGTKKDGEENSDITVIYRVSDTGQGMTAEQVKKLGDKYTRFNTEANRATEGTGLGMNITMNLIQMMNGDFSVESIPGMGTTFTVKIPQEDTGFAPFGKEWAENLEDLNNKLITNTRNMRITREFMPYGRVLVVDDVETNLYVARGLLAPYGLSIDTAASGFEAIDRVRDGAVYDIVLMDHMMPKMDGIEAAKIMRNMGYNHPIVALTANALAGQAQVFLDNGFDGYISKPIDIRQLNAILNKMIRNKQAPEVLEEARKQKSSLYTGEIMQPSITTQLAEIFVRDAEKSISVMESIYLNKCRRSDDVSMMIINAHAMKSALANIGEQDLSEGARKLEQAGRERNTKAIISQVPVFIEGLRKVIEKVSPKDEKAENEEENGISSEENLILLREKLLVIQAACSRYDKKNAKEILAELRRKAWPKETKDRLNVMAEHLLHSEFEEAATIAEEIFPY